MIINSVAYRHGKKIGDVPIEDISEVLKEPDTFVWLGVLDPKIEQLKQIQQEFSLHELAIEDALQAHQRPKIESYGDTLFIVMSTAQLVDDLPQFGETHIFLGRNFVVSVRHGASSSYQHVRARCESLPALMTKGPAFVAYSIMDFITDHLYEVADEIQTRFETIEAYLFTDQYDRETINRLYRMKAEMLHLRSAASPIDEICRQMERLHEDLVPKDLRPYFRDIADHALKIVSILDSVREMMTTAIQINLALVTFSQNETVKRLAGWGAILAVPTLVFSLYGMNFKWMPELDFKYGYPVAVGGTIAACLYLFRKLRKSGWV
ncbi:magnesium and cobalt transport protein CorA [Pararobbsia silviterrae]|uniref:Magnesium and cobalt transport protein CorA n=1 Tax=Pararobbsia silviterrae TaxID=1792498 RepID=A0A494Y3E4_9BURK|nr:magnesium and cobalt transport protein CorA [Pararobbsia silviterrae]RKP54842.1 magnesium and cobalt transport protein CorA [Pararobbsia silviterrae]